MAKQVIRPQASKPEDLLVFGYSCKLFRDDEKALYVDNGQHLIPWMEDSTLMIDRYDVRGALYDIETSAGCSNGGASALSQVEQKEEELSEHERYLALYHDLDAAADREEEESKRLQVELEAGSSSFNQVGFIYDANNPNHQHLSQQELWQQQYHHQQQQAAAGAAAVHPQGYTPNPDDDTFIPPPTLTLPPWMTVPSSIKQHKIIVKTAKFIAKQGSQMEIVLKTKQASNSMFGFLSFDNILNPYYKHMVTLIKTGKYNEEENPESNGSSEDASVPPASFNPPDAAPGIKTPVKAAAKPPPPDCSYSKLISKIRENQAKNLPLPSPAAITTDSRSQSPVVTEPPPVIPTTTGASAVVTPAAGANATTAVSAVSPDAAPTTQAGAIAATPTAAARPALSTSTPVATSDAASDGAPLTTTTKPFAGLVDYPSFNRTNDNGDYYSHTDTDDSDDPYNIAAVASKELSREKRSQKSVDSYEPKKKVPSPSKVETKRSKTIKSDSYDDIRWPRPDDQMTIDKIACYTVKNGPKFEKAVTARGDPRFEFLQSSHEHHPYYQLKCALYTEVFTTALSNNKTKHSQRAKDIKAVVFGGGGVSSAAVVARKSWSSSNNNNNNASKGSNNSNNNGSSSAAHTISFSIKQRRDQEVTLPATSFPLESSSSEEEMEELDQEEKRRRALDREERKKWRKAKREQFEKERKEKKEREEKDRKLKEEQEKRKLKELEEQENASGDEEMYDIFKYAQETGTGESSYASKEWHEPPAAAATPSVAPPPDRKLRRKKAAHAFLSKLKEEPQEEQQIIGPQLPPEMVAEMMKISPVPSPPASPTPSSPPLSPSHTPPQPPHSPTPIALTPPPPPPKESRSPSTAPPPPAAANDADVLQLSSILPPVASVSGKKRSSHKPSLLSAAVTSLLANEECAASVEEGGSKSVLARRRSDSKARRHKAKKRRDTSSPSPARQRTVASSSKKRKRSKHSSHHHHKKRRHHSPSSHRHHHSSSSVHHKSSKSSHNSKKKKSKASSKKDKSKKKKSRRRRSVSVSSVSSYSSSSASSRSRSLSRSRSRSSSSDSYRSSVSLKRRRSTSEQSASDVEVHVISDSDSSTRTSTSTRSTRSRSRASSVVSASLHPASSLLPSTPSSSRASSMSRDAGSTVGELKLASSSGAASPSPLLLPPTPLSKPTLPANFDIKNSTAAAKITQGLREKVHALMDKRKQDK